MSGWNAYIDTMTGSAPSIKRAAIVGAADGAVWARTEDTNQFKASEVELKAFVALFDDITNVPSKGADIEGVHYVVPRVEESLIFGKKENTGFFAAKTKSAVLIAVYEGPNEVASQVRKAVESMQTYLTSAGY
ncbi:CBN-PFN-1 protein [Caenorhabditis brenneri]|uniref:Profilin n=1 Tax=Caenorhabditis brenneri TaxID=135651 RepID=G0MJI3_CAEBE|nr:CBN-PFN-1 protein [Caenorhabditis brenneri]